MKIHPILPGLVAGVFMAEVQAAAPPTGKQAVPKKIDSALLVASGLSTPAGAVRNTSGTAKGNALVQDRPQVRRVGPSLNNGRVLIEAFVQRTNAAALAKNLAALGLRDAKTYPGVVTGWLPTNAISRLERVPGLRFAQAAQAATRAGSVTAQSDIALGAPIARGTYGVSGAGKRVGILSDSFDWAPYYFGPESSQIPASVASGDLPADIDIVADYSDGNDEGRAMAELVHDIAPGASIAFHTAYLGQWGFANGIDILAGLVPGMESHRCDVIVDDVYYYNEPWFADGVIAQAVNRAKAAGIPYFSAAGNDARKSFDDGPWRPSTVNAPFWNSGGGKLHQFNSDPAKPVTVLPIKLKAGVTSIMLQWADAYASTSPNDPSNLGAEHDIDFYLVYDDGTPALFYGDYVGGYSWSMGGDPIESFTVSNPWEDLPMGLVISYFEHRSGAKVPPSGSPPQLKLKWWGAGLTVEAFPEKSNKGTVVGHANTAGALAVGAVPYWETPAYGNPSPLLEPYSSSGGTALYYGVNGQPLPTPQLGLKPDFCATDAANTTFFYYDWEGDGWPNFFGTSAAAPSAAAIAALMLEAKPTLSPDQVATVLKDTALDMGDPGFDFDSGAGLVRAHEALKAVASLPPVLLGDLNGDGCVGRADLTLLRAAILARSLDPQYDLNRDGVVTIADARYLISLYTSPGGICP